MRTAFCLFVSLVFLGCGGGIRARVGSIEGPDVIYEQIPAHYAIHFIGTNPECYWSCNPPGAGVFDKPLQTNTSFTPDDIESDKVIKISVAITTDQWGPVIIDKDIQVINDPDIYVSEINGPETVEENMAVFYTVSAYGAPEIGYEWSIEPPYAGEFEYITAPIAKFTASQVDQDLDARIKVSVLPSSGVAVQKVLDITITDSGLPAVSGWARTWGNEERDNVQGLAIDCDGNSYITGYYYGTVDFDPGEGVDERKSKNSLDAYLSKFDMDGNFQWVRTWGSPREIFNDWDEGRAVAVDSSGDIYVLGIFRGTVDFDPGPGLTEHTAESYGDIFLSKFDTDGNFLWVLIWTAEYANSIMIDAMDNMYIVGSFFQTVDFDPSTIGVDLHTARNRDSFLVVLDSTSKFLWAETWGSLYGDDCQDVCVDTYGDIYVSGNFYGTIDLDPNETSEEEYTAVGDADIYLSKLDPAGALIFGRAWGGQEEDNLARIAVDNSGGVFVAGSFEDTVDFDPGPGIDVKVSNGWKDAYLCKLDENGNYHWSYTWGADTHYLDQANQITIDENGYVLLTGDFTGTIDFDPGTSVDEYSSQGQSDIFVTMFSPTGGYQWTVVLGSYLSEGGVDVATDRTGCIYVTGTFLKTVDFDPDPYDEDEHNSNGGIDVFITKYLGDGHW